MDVTKYDRQIRLFGFETQQRLSEMTVQILGGTTLISCEIIKNVVLLGVHKIIVEEQALSSIKRIVPVCLKDINENLVIEISNKVESSDFLFTVDKRADASNSYFICSKCLVIKKGGGVHECTACAGQSDGSIESTVQSVIGNDACRAATECLVGAFAVQEFLKTIQGQEHVKEYAFEF